MTISAVIITFNEEDHIGNCLDSLRDVADEVIVVDSHSKDNTKSICADREVHFVEHAFEGHVEQKNFALAQANCDFVLSLDADERLSLELYRSIHALKTGKEPVDGYTFNRLNNYCGQWIRHGGWYPDRKLRLWRKERGQWGGRNPHDKVILEKGAKVSHLNGDLLHYTVSSIDEHIDQIQSFSGIAARELIKSGKRSSLLKVVLSPVFKFLRDYVIKRGFLDGYYGFVIAANSAWAKYLKYLKAYEMSRKPHSPQSGRDGQSSM